jgi:hypothetical protein
MQSSVTKGQRAVDREKVGNCYSEYADRHSIYVISFELQVTLYGTKGGAGPGLSLLYVGLGLGSLIGGVVVRRTRAFRLVVVVSTARAGACYAVLASSVIGMSGSLPES